MDILKPESDINKWSLITKINGPWPVFVAVLLVAEGILGFWFFQADTMDERCIAGSIMALILIALLIAIVRIAPTNQDIEPTVEFSNNMEHVETKMINLLNKTQECIYYYGGVGFIGDFPDWRNALDAKLKSEKIKFVRLIDLKSLEKMNEVLKPIKDEDEVKKDVESYITFLKTHSKNLKYSGKLNKFYNFEGAPLWKYGIHHIIFDRKHVAIVFLTSLA